MKKVSVVYYSSTGNTEMMAKAVANGLDSFNVNLVSVDEADIDSVIQSDAIALGCPAMGSEELEETVMEPFVANLIDKGLEGKPLALFGSYDWGNGEWMRDWEDRMENAGAKLVSEGLIVNNEPNKDDLQKCKELASKLVDKLN